MARPVNIAPHSGKWNFEVFGRITVNNQVTRNGRAIVTVHSPKYWSRADR